MCVYVWMYGSVHMNNYYRPLDWLKNYIGTWHSGWRKEKNRKLWRICAVIAVVAALYECVCVCNICLCFRFRSIFHSHIVDWPPYFFFHEQRHIRFKLQSRKISNNVRNYLANTPSFFCCLFVYLCVCVCVCVCTHTLKPAYV